MSFLERTSNTSQSSVGFTQRVNEWHVGKESSANSKIKKNKTPQDITFSGHNERQKTSAVLKCLNFSVPLFIRVRKLFLVISTRSLYSHWWK